MSRMTLGTMNTEGVRAGLRAYSEAARQRVQAAVVRSGERCHNYALSMCPYDKEERDDFHMIEHLELVFSPDLAAAGFVGTEREAAFGFWERFGTPVLRGLLGAAVKWGDYAYEVGFYEADFLAAGQPFYPIYTEFGTTKMAAQPCIFPARDMERAQFRTELAEALAYRKGDMAA